MGWNSINVTARNKEISSKLLRQMLKDGELPGFYPGNRFLVDGDALDILLRTKSMESITKSAK